MRQPKKAGKTQNAPIYFLTWAGSKVNRTISLIAEYRLGKSCPYGSFFVENITSQDIEKIKSADKPNGEELAKLKSRPVKITQKYDYLLSEDLLNQEYANSHLDIEMAWIVLTSLPEIQRHIRNSLQHNITLSFLLCSFKPDKCLFYKR